MWHEESHGNTLQLHMSAVAFSVNSKQSNFKAALLQQFAKVFKFFKAIEAI